MMEIILNLVIFFIICGVLYVMQTKRLPFTFRVLSAMVIGGVFGFILQLIYGVDSSSLKDTVTWINIVSSIYVKMLQMVVMPLIFVSITSAIVNLDDAKALGKYGIRIISVLLLTTALSAIIAIAGTLAFGLNANDITIGDKETARMESLEKSGQEVNAATISSKIINVIPSNVFSAFAGNGESATLSVVFFSMFLGVAGLVLKKKKPKESAFFVNIINTAQAVVMEIVNIVLKFTPYGILALMAKFMASSNFAAMKSLGVFILASYVILGLIFVAHLVIISVFGYNPLTYIKKAFTCLVFAFTSRSSAACLPLTVETQEKKFGVPGTIASLAASFGTSIGQNGCAGMYPAMVAVMIAPTVGINPASPMFIIELVLVVTISSFGIAGVGGGATMAALVVLSAMGLPVGLVGVLISIEALIDMGRTLINVSDGLVAGLVTSKLSGEQNMEIYNSAQEAESF